MCVCNVHIPESFRIAAEAEASATATAIATTQVPVAAKLCIKKNYVSYRVYGTIV